MTELPTARQKSRAGDERRSRAARIGRPSEGVEVNKDAGLEMEDRKSLSRGQMNARACLGRRSAFEDCRDRPLPGDTKSFRTDEPCQLDIRLDEARVRVRARVCLSDITTTNLRENRWERIYRKFCEFKEGLMKERR